MKTEEITLSEYRALTARQSRKAKRASIPRAASDERVGLSALLSRGWSIEGLGHSGVPVRLYQPHTGRDTGEWETLKAACDRAKELERC